MGRASVVKSHVQLEMKFIKMKDKHGGFRVSKGLGRELFVLFVRMSISYCLNERSLQLFNKQFHDMTNVKQSVVCL